MRDEEYQVKLLLEKLTDEDKVKLQSLLPEAFSVRIGLTPEELSEMKVELLIPLRKILQGWILTKEFVPDLKGAYQNAQLNNFPSKIAFGRRDHSETEKQDPDQD